MEIDGSVNYHVNEGVLINMLRYTPMFFKGINMSIGFV